MNAYLVQKLQAKIAEYERLRTFPRSADVRLGRGHCARCFTPTICGNDECPCHIPQGVTCRARGCTAGLFVAIPTDSASAMLEAQKRLLDQVGYERSAA